MNKTRVAVYCRVSTDHNDQINSLKSQMIYFKEYIQKNTDWDLVEVFADEGLSGTSTKKRKEFLRMISMAKDKKIDLIITKEVSRFARNTVDTLTFTRELKALGIGVLFINDNINTLDNDGELRLTIMSSIAQEESRKTSERVKWGQKRRMEQGVVFGNGLYGYTLNNGKLNINEKEAEIVRMIFSAFVFEKKGGYTIAREMNMSGVKPKYANEWSSNAIIKMIRNEKYCGDLLQKKTCTPDFLSHKRINNNEFEEKLLIKNHHEPIVSREVFEMAQAELNKRSVKKADSSRHSVRYWCSGKVFCGECGCRYVSSSSKSKKGYVYKGWRCFNAKNNGAKTSCSNKSISDRALLGNVWMVFSYYIKNIDFLTQIKKDVELISLNTNKTNINNTEKKLRKLQKKCKAALEHYMEEVISMEDYLFLKDKYSKEIDVIKKELISEKDTATNKYDIKEQIDNYIFSIEEKINKNIPDEYLLSNLIERIVVLKNKRIDLTFKYLPYVFSIINSSEYNLITVRYI